ncbi:hypothetical protein F0U62_31000 [Cystobacter fuscus]|uniref:NACHT domain-containing protein n=1 Tax=Cystobacter fuscus TaxID=43 RepID=UPI002B32383E|nr:hypothetical protein F0U62_31000 [Cystobacter fuscus]
MSLTEKITTGIAKLVWSAMKTHVDSHVKDFLTKRRIERSVEEAVDRVVVELERFLVYEVREENQRALVVEQCLLELQPLVLKPETLFRGSLDGQRIFDQLYPNEQYPQAIREERLDAVWALFVPRILALLCKLALAIEEWRIEGWREGFRRLDEVAQQLAKLQVEIDTMVRRPSERSDELFERVRRLRRQRRELRVEVTGLGGEAPSTVQLDAMFVHPIFRHQSDKVKSRIMTEANVATGALLQKRGRSVIIAGPGAGKTTWTKWVERTIEARSEPMIVVRIELRQHSSGFPSIHKIVKDEAGSHLAEELDADILRTWFDSGRVHAVIDGLDELIPATRESALAWLTGLGESIGSGAVVITSRPLTTDHLDRLASPTWTTWHLMPFDQERVCDYIERWYKHAPLLPEAERKVDARALAREWSMDSTLRNLTGNPLLLSTLLTVHHVDGALPQGRARLYQRYLDGMLGSWDARRKVDAPRVRLDVTAQRWILRNIAIFMNASGHDAVEESELEPVVAKALSTSEIKASATDVLAQLRERSGLLIGPGTWSFSHKSIGEFLLAEAIIEGNLSTSGGGRLDRMWLYSKRHEDRLNVAFFLWAGLAPASDLEAMISILLSGSYDDQVLGLGLANDQFFRIGGSCRIQVGAAMARLTPPSGKNDSSTWVFPVQGSDNLPHDLPTGEVELRGVSDYETSSSLLNKLASSSAISWSDVKTHSGPARDWLWITGPRPACWYETEDGQPPPSTQIENPKRLVATGCMVSSDKRSPGPRDRRRLHRQCQVTTSE